MISGSSGFISYKKDLSGFLNRKEMYSAHQHNSFAFRTETGDTIGVGIDYNADLEHTEWGVELFNSFLIGKSRTFIDETSYYCTFKSIRGHKVWEMLVIFPFAMFAGEASYYFDPFYEYKVEGLLTDGETEFYIFRVEHRQDGKRNLLKPRIGYKFYHNSFPAAAVQAIPLHKQIVWIHTDLEQDYKEILAAASAALMIISMP